jgi:methylase of polypeptide subunit release factors
VEAKLQLRVQRYGWDAASNYYENGWRVPLAAAQAALLEAAALQPGERVIEAACGSGLVTRAAAAAVGRAGEVLATDLSQTMTDLTARECARLGVLFQHAAFMVRLGRTTRAGVSRHQFYARPSHALVEHVRRFSGQRPLESDFSGDR